MVCPDGERGDFTKLAENCYPCSIKIRSLDMPQANTYAFTELTVLMMSYVPGYKRGSEYTDHYRHVVASHGFNPDEVNEDVFNEPHGK